MGLKRGVVLVVAICYCVMASHAQGVTELTQKFNAYQSSSPKTKLQLVFNQNKFSPGDTAWFKAYYLKEDLTRLEGNYLIDVNLVNARGQVVNHLIFQVNDGLGQNQLAIPDSLPAGIYLVTAHTLMNHVDPDYIFKKEITVVRQNAIVKVDEVVSKPVVEDGAMMLTRDPKKESVKIQFSSTFGFALQKEKLIVIVTSRGKIFYTTTFSPGTDELIDLRIPLHELPRGVAHVSLLTQAGKVLDSRDFYNPGDDQVKAKIQPNKDYFQTGEKVRLEVSITENGNPVEGEFSARVLNAELFNNVQQISSADELIFPSDVIGRISINQSDSLALTILDNFLAQFTRDLPWPKIISNEISNKRPQSANNIEKRGVAYFTDTNLPVPDFTQILVYLQRSKTHRETFTEGNGKFWINLPYEFDQDEFFYLARVRGNTEIVNVNVEWEDESIKLPRAPNSREAESPDSYATFAKKMKLIDQSFGFRESTAGSTTVTRKDFETIIATADITKNIQDYILFPSMEELLKEVIPSVFHRKTKTKSIVRVQLFPPMKATNDPVYIIDDIATKNTSFFLSLKPADILTMKIIRDPKKLYPLGLLGKNGIILVQTKKGDVRDQPEDPNRRAEGISKSVDFKAPNITSNGSAHRPDFRSTIYWNPSVKTDSFGKAVVEFFCSGDVGKLLINISGLTSTGEPFSKDHEIEVGIAPGKN